MLIIRFYLVVCRKNSNFVVIFKKQSDYKQKIAYIFEYECPI